jgi:predicted  nucleic acid-binding Zn-ribbon protein
MESDEMINHFAIGRDERVSNGIGLGEQSIIGHRMQEVLQAHAERSQSEIDRELGQLHQTINALGDTLQRLHDRLAPISVPTPERSDRTEAAEPQAPSKVGSSIQSARQGVQLYNAKLLELMAKLAI